MLSDADREMLLDAACQIIDSSFDSTIFLNEACSLSKKLKRESSNENEERPISLSAKETPAMERFMTATCEDCLSSKEDQDRVLFATPTLARQIVEIVQADSLAKQPLLTTLTREKLQTCTEMIRVCLEKSNINKELLTSLLLKHNLPLEVIWTLHRISAMELDTYLKSKLERDEAFRMKFSEALVALCRGPQETQPLRQEMISGFTAYLLKKSFADKRTSTAQVERQILDSVLQDVMALSAPPCEEETLALPSHFLTMTDTMEADTLKKFAVHSLSLILSHGANTSVQEYMMSEMDNSSAMRNTILHMMIKHFFLPLDSGEAIGVLTRTMELQQINCGHIFVYLSALYTSFSDASSKVKEHIQSLISSAVDKSDSIALYVPFFLARLSTVQGSHCFPCYADWFRATFCGPSSLALLRPGYTFLIKFLSSLVPSESPERLKAYIFHRPTQPPKCKDYYEDFVVLAKTRLMDLGVPLYEQMNRMYDNSDCTDTSCKDQQKKTTAADSAQQDVERALAAFVETRKIPAALIQASIFQRPYFMGKFLPALLKPRVLPDQPDERMLLIGEVNRSGKIPASVYSHYLHQCEREKQLLLEGVFDVDDEDEMDELTLPLIEQLEKKLEKFMLAVLQGETETEKACLTSTVEKVFALLSEAPLNPCDQTIAVDLCKNQRTSVDSCSKISMMLLKHLSILVTEGRKQGENRHNAVALYSSVARLVQVLLQRFPQLRADLYSNVLTVLKQRKTEHLKITSPGVPAMCLSLAVLPYRLTVTIDKGVCSSKRSYEDISFIQAFVLCLDIVNADVDVFRLCLDYVEAACQHLAALARRLEEEDVIDLGNTGTTEEDLLPSSLVKKFYLACRRQGLTDSTPTHTQVSLQSDLTDLAASVLNDEILKQLFQRHQLSLREWIELELSVDTTKDCLSHIDRWSYIWETSSFFLSQGLDMTSFCKTVIFKLTQHCCSQPGTSSDSVGGQQKVGHFLQLLQKLTTKLPVGDGKGPTFLRDVVASSQSVSHVFRFAFELPAHLLFCNSLQEPCEEQNVSSALTTIDYLLKSPHNKGAYLSLESTIYILQAIDSVMTAQPSLAASAFDPVALHPVIFISVLVHKSVIEGLNLVEGSRLSLAPWYCKLIAAERWIQRTDNTLRASDCKKDVPSQENWQKAAAVFSHLLQNSLSSSPNKLNLDPGVRTHLLEMLVASLTLNGACSDAENSKDRGLVKIFVEIVEAHVDVLTQLLSTDKRQQHATHSLRSQLGMDAHPWMTPLRDLLILRLAKNVPAETVMHSPRGNVTSAVVSAYWRVLSYAQDSGANKLEGFQTDLSQWIKSLIDLSSPEQLAAIPEVPASLRCSDLLLIRYIMEKKRMRKSS